MCKEGIRIGRETAVRLSSDVVNGFTLNANALKPDPNRVGVILGISPAGMIAGDSVALCVVDGQSVQYIGFCTSDRPSVELRVETHGQLVTGALSVQSLWATPVAYSLTELYLTKKLEEL